MFMKSIEATTPHGVGIILLQPLFARKSAEALAEPMGGRVGIFDDPEPDYLTMLQETPNKLDHGLCAQHR
jgi:hypothetical protein